MNLVRDEQIIVVGSDASTAESRLSGSGLVDRPSDRGADATELIIDLGRYYRVTSAHLAAVEGRDAPLDVAISFDDGTGTYKCAQSKQNIRSIHVMLNLLLLFYSRADLFESMGDDIAWTTNEDGIFEIGHLLNLVNPDRGTRRVKITAHAQDVELAFRWELLGCPYTGNILSVIYMYFRKNV